MLWNIPAEKLSPWKAVLPQQVCEQHLWSTVKTTERWDSRRKDHLSAFKASSLQPVSWFELRH